MRGSRHPEGPIRSLFEEENDDDEQIPRECWERIEFVRHADAVRDRSVEGVSIEFWSIGKVLSRAIVQFNDRL